MGLNKNQRVIITIGVVVFVLMGLFPPWTSVHKSYSAEPSGYCFIGSPPRPYKYNNAGLIRTYKIKIDTTRLLIQWIVIIVASSGGVLIKGGRKDENVQQSS